MDSRIFGILKRVQSEQDEGRREELKAETNLELAQHFLRHPQDMEELAFDLFNLAFSDTEAGDIVNQLIEVKTVGLNETDYIEEDLRGMRAYFQGKGGQIRSDIIRYERQQMPREELVTAIDMHWDDLQSNFWGSLEKLQAQAFEKVRVAPAQRLVALAQTAVVSGASYGSFAAATLSSAQIDPILDNVSIKSRGQRPVIFGTNIAIRKLAAIGLTYGFEIQRGIFTSGVIGTYKGSPVLELENFENFDGSLVIPNDQLFIIGRNAGRMTWFGNQPKVQQLRLPAFQMRWEAARDVGISLYGSSKGRLGRIVLT